MKLKIALLKGVIASYTEGFYDRLLLRDDLEIKIYCQENIPGKNIKVIHDRYPKNAKVLKFISLKDEKATWQFIPWKEIIRDYDVIFVDGNPRNLSHLLLGTFLRLTNKKVVLWTMGHSFRNNSITENIRLWWSRIFKHILLYTDKEVSFLKQKGFKSNYMIGQNNGLDQRKIDAVAAQWSAFELKAWKKENKLEEKTLILSCARLSSKNNFSQLIKALPYIIDKVPNLLWCIIGKGQDEERLKSEINRTGLANYVYFVGELFDEQSLAPWFMTSQLLVHPAAIGLSILHAFGYGLPVITHGNSEDHGPEYAAFEPEDTGRNFKKDDINSLSETIVGLLKDENARLQMTSNILRVVREEYNVDVMVDRFVKIANKAFNNQSIY